MKRPPCVSSGSGDSLARGLPSSPPGAHRRTHVRCRVIRPLGESADEPRFTIAVRVQTVVAASLVMEATGVTPAGALPLHAVRWAVTRTRVHRAPLRGALGVLASLAAWPGELNALEARLPTQSYSCRSRRKPAGYCR